MVIKKYKYHILNFWSIIQSEYCLFEYMTFNDKTITFSYLNHVNDGYLSIKFQKSKINI